MKDESYIEYDKYGKCHGAIFSLISVSIQRFNSQFKYFNKN